LTCFVPPALVDEVLAITDRDEQRLRALPSRLGVYVVLGLCLLRTKAAPAVLRAMIPAGLLARLAGLGWRVPASTTLTALRDRIGAVPFPLLLRALTRATPTRVRSWSHAFGLRVCAWDGTEIAVADTAANRDHFRRHRRRRGDTTSAVGAPKARLLVLLACGTRQILGAVTGTLGQGEVTLAHQLKSCLRAGMLLLADRNFLGYRLWTAARAQGAHLLWRAKNNKPLLTPQQRLTDGSYLARLHDPADARAWRHRVNANRKRGHRPPTPRPITGTTVRVIEALITVTVNGHTRTEHYRLVTSLLDPAIAPAEQLVALYARRWVAETGIREIKTVLLAGKPLRGTTPIRALQELWATLVVYQTLRLLICQAALTTELDPSRISFTAARDLAQARLTTTPRQASTHITQACHDLRQQLITQHTSYRIFPRTVTTTPTRYPRKTKTRQPTSTKASYRADITTPTNTQPPTRSPTTPAQPRAT
jgi:hypothetical protein